MQFTTILAALVFVSSLATQAQVKAPIEVDAALLSEIQKIPAIDNHSHILKVIPTGATDDETDGLPCISPIETDSPALLSARSNPLYYEARQALFGYAFKDDAPEHLQPYEAHKQIVRQQKGETYPAWVLDQIGTEVILANRVAMGPGLTPPRFRWVAFDDALMYPLDNSGLKTASPDRNFFFGRVTMLLGRYQQDLGVTLPPSIDAYFQKVVVPTLRRQKQNGAVAIKFEAAYLRSLEFGRVDDSEAARIYARYIQGGVPEDGEYRRLQDYLFRAIAGEAGRLGLAVHIHTGFGCGHYFDLKGANVELLESVFDDAALRGTRFVMLHAAYPHDKEVALLLSKPNVYADISLQSLMLSSHELGAALRGWMELFPEKVLFGSDLGPGDPGADWEEQGWVAGQNARQALALALSGMVRDGMITRARALVMARMVLHDNAAHLYGF